MQGVCQWCIPVCFDAQRDKLILRRSGFSVFLVLLAGLLLPLSLRGQETPQALSSIAGKTFYRWDIGAVGESVGIETIDIPVSRVEVVLVAAGDTLRTRTDDQGKFTFSGIVPKRVTLSMTSDDYAPFSETFELMPGENVVIVPRRKKEEILDAAKVTAEAPVMTMRGDTLVYHAAALRVNEGDYAIDLLKQMPGVEIDATTGEIKISGKQVHRSYINGALIFGLNPMDPMENLRAEQVVAMEVYDERDPDEVLDNIVREKQRVVNIKTKDPILSSTDLQVRAIAGADEQRQESGDRQYRYAAGTNAHFFSELTQLSADVVTNNVGMNSSNISAVPMPQSTYRQTTDLDLGFNRYWDSPLFGNGLNTRYSYTHDRIQSRRRTLQEYFEMPGTPAHTQEDETSSTRLAEQHRFETAFAYRTGSRVTVQWRQQFNLSRINTDGLSASSLVYDGRNPMTQNETSFSGDKAWNLSETVTVGFKPGKNGKPGPNLTLNFMLRKNNLDSWNLDTLASSYTKRYLTKEGNKLSQYWMGSIRHSLYSNRSATRNIQLTLNYDISYRLENQLQEAYDLYGVDEPALNPANTYDFTFSNLQHSLRLGSIYGTWGNAKNTSIRFDLNFLLNQVIDRERIPEAYSGNKTYWGIMPLLSFSVNRVNLSLSSTLKTPSVDQLRRRINDTRPLSLVGGNPDLKQSQAFTFRLQKGRAMQAKTWTTDWNASFQYERNPLVQRILIFQEETVLDEYDGYRVPAGASLNRTENADYGLTAQVILNTSARLSLLKGKLKPTVTIQPRLDYRLMPQYYGDVLDRTAEWTPSLNATVMAPLWKGAQVSLRGNAAYIRAISQESTMDRKAIRGQLDVDASTEFLKHAYFQGSYSWRPVRDLSEPSLNRDLQQLNLAVGINLLKKDLKICLRGIDLLRSGSVYSITMGPSSVTHTWTPVYGRYFVLDISYRFNNSGGKVMPRYGL